MSGIYKLVSEGYMDNDCASSTFNECYEYKDDVMWKVCDSHKWVPDVMREIIVGRKGNLKMISCWKFDYDNKSIYPLYGQRWTVSSPDYVPNPSIYIGFGISGEFGFERTVRSGDIHDILEEIGYYNGVVNFCEEWPAEFLFEFILAHLNNKLIDTSNDKTLSFEEARREWNIG